MSCFLNYNLSITGDCGNTNSGAFDISIVGSAPDFSINWLSPFSGSVLISTTAYTETTYSYTGLSAGTYSFTLSDSCSAQTNMSVNVHISSGTSTNIISSNNTLCNLNNGSITASTATLYGVASFQLYDINNYIISTGTSETNTYEFKNLSASTYYVIGDDGAGCTGRSQTVIVQSSTTLSYGFYTINNTGCGLNSGRIMVTGLTGTPPYSYLWSNSQTGDTITGLTDGTYSLTITDSTGCQATNTTSIGTISSVQIPSVITTPPNCFTPDGEITVYAVGGTTPYYYLCSNGDSSVSFGNNYTFTGLSSGQYTVTVTDSGLCNATKDVILIPPNSFDVSSVTTISSNCNNNDGSLTVQLFGTLGLYTYELSGNNVSQIITKNSLSHTFVGLTSGIYNLNVNNNSLSACSFSGSYQINNFNKFEFSAQTTGTTCSLNNGSVKINISTGGTAPYTVSMVGYGTFQTTESEILLTSLSAGSYIIDIIDFDRCKQTKPITINTSTDVDFVLIEDSQTLNAIVFQGEPPYSYLWSQNVNGQTGNTVSNLTAGTYSLTVIDNFGCTKTRSLQLLGPININSYQVYSISNTTFQNNLITVTKGPEEMLLEGFADLSSSDTNCVLNQSIFTAEVTVDGTTTTVPFYTGSTLNDYPTDEEWITLITNILTGYTGILSVNFNLSTNQFELQTECEGNYFNNVLTTINLIISYDISCQELGVYKQFQNADDFNFMNGDQYWFQ